MDTVALKIIFMVGFASAFVIRFPYQKQNKRNRISIHRKTWQEKSLLVLVYIGMIVLPLMYIFSPWLRIADYALVVRFGYLGAVCFGFALWLFWRSHDDLGKNWSATLEIREGHTLVTNGVYQKIRHPMYTAIWLWCAAQALLLPNWLAGPAGLISFGILYIFRVGSEEQMMLEEFGEDYKVYMKRTKRLIPYIL